MSSEKPSKTRQVLLGFYNRKINKLYVFLPGFGLLFVSRTTGGLSMGYLDRNKLIAKNDHATFIFNNQGISSIHRTISDNNTVIYMKPSVDFIVKRNGVKGVLQEIENQFSNMPFAARLVWMMVFKTLNWASESGTILSKNVSVLTEKQASELGADSDCPCLYIKLQLSQKMVIPLSRAMISLQSYAYSRLSYRWPSGFVVGKFPGLVTTSYSNEDLKRKRNPKREN